MEVKVRTRPGWPPGGAHLPEDMFTLSRRNEVLTNRKNIPETSLQGFVEMEGTTLVDIYATSATATQLTG